LPFLGQNQYVLDGSQTTCTFDFISRNLSSTIIFVLMVTLGFVLPLFVIIICYILILVYVKKNSSKLNGHIHRSSSTKRTLKVNDRLTFATSDNKRYKGLSKNFEVEIKIAKTSFLVIIVFCFVWIPYVLIALIGQFSTNRHIYVTPFTALFPSLLAKSSSVLNPIVYVLTTQKKKI
jgi:phage shock protein PspC (stress-responsive transcriptional regulator)